MCQGRELQMDAEKIDEPHQKSGGNSRSKRPRASYTGLAPTPVFHNLTADLPCRWANCQDICPDLCAYYTHLRRHMWTGKDARNETGERCRWRECAATQPWTPTHVYYHGYHEKLKLLGDRKLASRRDFKCYLPTQNRHTVDVFDAFECEWADCEYVLESPEDFNFHLLVHVHETIEGTDWHKDMYRCQWTDCRLDFTYSLLRGHVKSHSSQKDSSCSTCGAIFRSANKFLDHFRRQMQPASQSESLQCRYCSKAFFHDRILRDHERQHISQYKCPFCEMTMPAPNDLRGHIATRHTTDRPFACGQCPSRFKLPRNLSTHVERVHNSKEMRCKHNECRFTTRSHYKMRRHRLQGHSEGESRIYACHLCSERFEIEGHLLSRHLVAEHGLQWPAGHRRFFYVRDPAEGVFRLQTFRYESAEISEIVPEGVDIDKAGTAALRARHDNDGEEEDEEGGEAGGS
ncbi:histone H4 transcription factor-like isoform X2 [Varroa jacobsoni]|uniref:C2H2-type domain-containing protein n=1 Tax=Varroa destructor TaxID=109461 RepID=A0A7M7KVF7_VARDE|nr:histone H4 transcription factor-like isoform X2 [Varroa destructor]XP_022691704.1 histone H4 transcription factor-like isoform X2 [Varroa jacobsoni]